MRNGADAEEKGTQDVGHQRGTWGEGRQRGTRRCFSVSQKNVSKQRICCFGLSGYLTAIVTSCMRSFQSVSLSVCSKGGPCDRSTGTSSHTTWKFWTPPPPHRDIPRPVQICSFGDPLPNTYWQVFCWPSTDRPFCLFRVKIGGYYCWIVYFSCLLNFSLR